MLKHAGSALLLTALASCVSTPAPPALTPDADLERFVREVERGLEAHEWQNLLARADPGHFRTQVVERGMGEAQYLAELFGLHRVDNQIRRGDEVDWSDLARIETVELESLTSEEDEHHLRGHVTLEDGTALRLDARITRVLGRLVLSGAVG